MTTKEKAIIIDLDGTLFNVDHRAHFMETRPKNYDQFEAGIVDDTLNQWCYDLIQLYRKADYNIIILTGRHERSRNVTKDVLNKYNVSYEHLFCAKDDDDRADETIKHEIYVREIQPLYDVAFVVEDRKRVVKMWREIGVTCLQCAEGDF
jgi:FMN phosphatase YigB (HAD superfamily)